MQYSQLFFYKFLFLLELIVAEVIFTYKLKRKEHFLIKFVCCLLGIFLLTFLYPIGDYSYNFYYTSIMFFVIFGLSFACIFILFDDSWQNLLFLSLAAYATQHFTYEAYNFFLNVFQIDSNNAFLGYGQSGEVTNIFNLPSVITYIFSYLDIYWLFYFLFAYKIEKNKPLKIKSTKLLLFLLMILLVDIVFNALITYHSYESFDKLYVMLSESYNMISTLSILMIMFGYLKERDLEVEVNVYQKLLNDQKNQYQQSKANIELLNMKCHDLKHQIHSLATSNAYINKDELLEMSNVIDIYDNGFKTDNEALNIVLMEKEYAAREFGIHLSVIADGSSLNFLKESEVYSIFGNALDNAIEASKGVSENKRYISIVVSKKNKFLLIKIQNYFSNNLEFNNDLPKTTKEDKLFHGYGLKSIRYIVENHGGSLSINTENDIFKLSILFPLEN